MDKIVFDSFKLTQACYEKFPTDPSKKDECRVDAEIHERGKSDPPNIIHFYRNKTTYLFGPEDTPKVPRLRELGFDDQNTSLQNTISAAVELNYVVKVDLLDKEPKMKPTLTPIVAKMIDLITAGEIVAPDELQKKAITSFFQSLQGLSAEEQAALLRSLTSLTKVEWLTDANRPRAEWLQTAMKFGNDLGQTGASFEGDSDAQQIWKALPFDIWIYMSTEGTNLKTIKNTLDQLQGLIRKNPKAPAETKDLFDFLIKKLEPLSKGPWLAGNLEARTRYNKLLGELKLAVQDHRAELMGLEPNPALQRSLTYNILDASQVSLLATRVMTEMDENGVTEDWIKKNAGAVTKVMVPHFTLTPGVGKNPLVQVDLGALESSVQDLIKKHPGKETEYKVASLAVLRQLFGKNLTASKVTAWAQNQEMELEFKLGEADYKKLKQLGLSLAPSGKKGASVTRDIILPIGHGTVMAGGIGLMVFGLSNKDQYGIVGNPFYHTGVGLMGFGAGALTCNLFWKQKNAGIQFLTDTLCGLGVGAATTGLSFAVQELDARGTGPGNPRNDGRNPVSPYGP